MKILLIYASNSGSTYLAAKTIKETLESKFAKNVKNNENIVKIQKAAETNPEDLEGYDVILIGSPSWNVNNKEGQPHETISELFERIKKVANLKEKLKAKKFAVFGCGDSSAYIKFCGAVDEIEQFVKEIGGLQIVPSLKLDAFYFDLDNNLQKTKEWALLLANELTISEHKAP